MIPRYEFFLLPILIGIALIILPEFSYIKGDKTQCHFHTIGARRTLQGNETLDVVYLYSQMCPSVDNPYTIEVEMTGPDKIWTASGLSRFLRLPPSREESRVECRLLRYSNAVEDGKHNRTLLQMFFWAEPSHFDGIVTPHERRYYAYRIQCPVKLEVLRVTR